MEEKIIEFNKSSRNNKKYSVVVKDLNTGKMRTIHFGSLNHEQYKDKTPLKLYSDKDHLDKKRKMNYYNRHSKIPNRKQAIEFEKEKSKGYYNPKILSHIYLW